MENSRRDIDRFKNFFPYPTKSNDRLCMRYNQYKRNRKRNESIKEGKFHNRDPADHENIDCDHCDDPYTCNHYGCVYGS